MVIGMVRETCGWLPFLDEKSKSMQCLKGLTKEGINSSLNQ